MTELTDDILTKIGFTDYDDEHCTWGNRRLYFAKSETDFECLQIIEYGDYPEENERGGGFVYSGWFDTIRNDGKMENHMYLNTVEDLVLAVKSFRSELYERVLERVKSIDL